MIFYSINISNMAFKSSGNQSVVHLRNKFNFWKIHGIMNTSGLLQSK